MKVILVEDEAILAKYLVRALNDEGYTVEKFACLEDALIYVKNEDFDLLIVDSMLPDGEGIELIKQLRKTNSKIPIILLTVKNKITDKVQGFDAGADDYITKPFNLEEFLARIRALYRRSLLKNNSTQLSTDNLILDIYNGKVMRGDREIVLTAKEFSLLKYLLENKGRILSRSLIASHCWDMNFDPMTNIIDVHIKNLRQKIDRNFSTKLIKTIRRRGYRIKDVPTVKD